MASTWHTKSAYSYNDSPYASLKREGGGNEESFSDRFPPVCCLRGGELAVWRKADVQLNRVAGGRPMLVACLTSIAATHVPTYIL